MFPSKLHINLLKKTIETLFLNPKSLLKNTKSFYLRTMIRIVFLGFGNVGYHICNALHQSNKVSVCQIYNRSAISLPSELTAIPFTTKLSELVDADIYIIAIPDDAIATFSETLPFQNKLVVHTSGSVPLNVLSEKNRKGVFYPLQSFSKNREVPFNEIPICIETVEASDRVLLQSLGEILSEKVVVVSSEARLKLHLAAVFVNNFTNHMYSIGSAILEENELPFSLLQPLIAETARKIETLSPSEAQTGPARRNDTKTIEKHLHLLGNGTNRTVYQEITKAIQEKYNAPHGKKL